MSIYTQPTLEGGMDQTLIEVARTVPSFTIGFLIFVWGLIFVGGSTTQKAKGGFSDSPMWAVMASLATMLIALIMTIKEGLITLQVLSVVIAITITSGLWLFFSRKRGEF